MACDLLPCAPMAFRMNFVADVTAMFRDHLTALGYHLPPTLPDEAVRIRYFNLSHRLIPARPRAIHHAVGFTCPPAVQAGLHLLEGKITRGDDLRPHLSRGLLNIDYSDALLNDWGIYHFHLGTTLDADGFITRTGPLLFARIEANDAYFIDVRAHGGWTSQDLLRAVHANWAPTIERFRLRGFEHLVYAPGKGPPTDAQIKDLRRAGAFVTHELAPGQIYMSIGGGYATDGTSINVVWKNDAFVRHIRDLEKATADFEAQLRNDLRLQGGAQLPDPVEVVLKRRLNGELVAVVGADMAEMPVGTLSLI